MVKKNSNDNSSYSKDIKNESDNNLNGHVSDEKLINELLYIKEALSNNELDLSPEEIGRAHV